MKFEGQAKYVTAYNFSLMSTYTHSLFFFGTSVQFMGIYLL